MPERFSILLYRISLCGCLLGAVATLYLLGGLAGLVGNPLLNLSAALGVFLAAFFFLHAFFIQMPDKNRWSLALWLLVFLILSADILLALLPPTARDELTHHLAVPRLYVKAGRILEVPFAPYSYYPALLDMLYTPWVRWGWDSVPKLIHGLFGFLTGLLLYAYLARRLSPLYGLLGFLIFVSTPAILRLSTWAYVDLGLTFYCTASLLCLLRWLEEGERRMADGEWRNSQSAIRNPQFVWLILAGLSAGFALTAKPNALLALLVLVLLLALALGREKHRGMTEVTSGSFLFLLVALIPISPWLVKNLLWTGNPFFPFLTGLLGGAGADGGGVSLGDGSGLGIFAKRELFYGESLWQIAALPLRIFFSGRDDAAQYFDGVLNPILILFLPWSFKGKWREEKGLIFAFAVVYILYAVFLTELRIRYVLPIIPPLVILLVYGVHNVYLRIARPPLLYGLVAFLLALNGVYLWNYFRALSPLDYLRGRENREGYLSRMLSEYPAVQYINQNLPSKAKVYFIFVGRRVYYCERDYFHDSGELPSFFLQTVQAAQNEEETKVKLQESGITHLLVRLDLFLRFLNDNLAQPKREMVVRFQARYLTLLYNQGGYAVYAVRTEA